MFILLQFENYLLLISFKPQKPPDIAVIETGIISGFIKCG